MRPFGILIVILATLAICRPCSAAPAGTPDDAQRMQVPWPEWWGDMPPPGPLDVSPPVRDGARSQVAPARPTAALLDTLASWLTANFGLPAAQDRPRVERVPRARLAALRYRGLVSDRARHMPDAGGSAGPLGDLQAVFAVYDDQRRTIYLPDDWEGETPADVSVLVHELVHHLQNVAGLTFSCPQERERVAYDAQARWLALFAKTLETELGIDAFDTLVRTRCFN